MPGICGKCWKINNDLFKDTPTDSYHTYVCQTCLDQAEKKKQEEVDWCIKQYGVLDEFEVLKIYMTYYIIKIGIKYAVDWWDIRIKTFDEFKSDLRFVYDCKWRLKIC